jgi:phospholipase A1
MKRFEKRTVLFFRYPIPCFGFMLLLNAVILLPSSAIADNLLDCMSKNFQTADPNMTIAELQLQCEKEIKDDAYEIVKEKNQIAVVEDRMQQEREHVLQPFTLMAHKPNYVLLAAYNLSGHDTTLWQDEFNDRIVDDWENTEAQFQLSVKFPLLVNMLDNTFDIYAAYTNRSFWQVYYDDSAPFRETNHEPEAWVQFQPGWEIFGFKNTWNSFGINHQSNGRGGTLSRSWNRLFAWLTVERSNLAMSFKPWYRIPENDEDDDNPDITDYLGHFELSATYKWRENVFSVMSRNNLESGFEKGTVELSWSFPLWGWPYLKGYVQYFNGYGRSLIDYNQHSNVIGLGFSLTDWL